MKERLSADVFMIPVERIKKGFFTDSYFNRTREILLRDGNHARVLMQVFCRDDCVLCGIDEALAIVRRCADNPDDLLIYALHDGDRVMKGETVLTIEGEYAHFAHLETVYLGVLARGTSVATSVHEVVQAADDRTVLFFASRFDHYLVQSFDGYAAHIGGAQAVSTDANGSFWGEWGVGTIPHGLIAAYGGDTLEACRAFRKHVPEEINLIALVDFWNDCIGTSIEVARHFGRQLWGVRLDTAGDLRDVSVMGRGADSFGVNPELVSMLRETLDREGFPWVRIVVSGGFIREKVERFVEQKVPFDAVGVGSAFFSKRVDFTADVVQVDKKPLAKVGRSLKPNPRLKKVW
jgi:nicotinate phosphoribosyltransferase